MAEQTPGEGSKQLDAYHELLGIPPAEQPPTYYRLLGLSLFESNASVIERAADRQMAALHAFKTGPFAAASQTLLTEVAKARRVLLNNQERAAYDAVLRQRQLSSSAAPVATVATQGPVFAQGSSATSLPSPLAPDPLQSPSFGIAPLVTSRDVRRRSSAGLVMAASAGVVVLVIAIGLLVLWNGESNPPEVVGANGKPPSEQSNTGQPANVPPPPIAPPTPIDPPPQQEARVTPPELPDDQKVRPDEPVPTEPANESPTQMAPADEKPSTAETETERETGTQRAAAEQDVPREATAAERAEKRTRIESAKAELREHPAFKKYYDHLAAKPASVKANGPKLALMIWTEAGTNRTIAEDPVSFAAAMEEVERLALAGDEFSSALQAIDARRNLGLAGLTPEEATLAKCEVLRRAAEKAAEPGTKAENRMEVKKWVIDLAQQELSGSDPKTLEVLLPLMTTLSKTTAERFDSARALLPLAEDAVDQQRTEAASLVVEQLDAVLKSAFGKERKVIVTQVDAVKQRLEAQQRVANLAKAVTDNPEDPAANQAYGLHLLEQAEWRTALKHLAKGSDADLKQLAEATLSTTEAGAAKVELADRWRAAEALEESQRLPLARMLYGDALASSELTGIARAAVEAKLQSLGSGPTADLSEGLARVEFGPPDTALESDGEWIDLLPLLKYPDDAVRGDWVVRDGHWSLANGPHAQVQCPISLDDCSYEVQLDFEMVNGREINFNLPVGDRAVTLIVAGYVNSGGLTHLAYINGRGPDANPEAVRGFLLSPGKHKCEIQVQLDGFEATIAFSLDGKPVFQHTGLIGDLTSNMDMRIPRRECLGFGGHEADVEFHAVRARITGRRTPVRERRRIPLNQPIELLSEIDFKEDVHFGDWYRKDRAVVIEAPEPRALLRMPVDLTGCSYSMSVGIRVLSEKPGTTGIGLPVGNRAVLAMLNGWRDLGTYSYFDSIDGKAAKDLPAARKGPVIQSGRDHRCDVSVQLQGESALLKVSLDGKELYSYEGPPHSLHTRWDWRALTSSQPVLGTNEQQVRFTNCRLTVTDGDAWLLGETPLPWPADVMKRKATKLSSLPFRKLEGYAFDPSQMQTPAIDGLPVNDLFYMHAHARVEFDIPAGAQYFTAYAYCGRSGSARFTAKVDGEVRYDRSYQAIDPVFVRLPSGAKKLELFTGELGAADWDHTCWVNAAFR